MAGLPQKSSPRGAGLVTAWIPVPLRGLTGGQQTVRVAGQTVGEVLDALDVLYPGIKARLSQGGALRPGVAVAVDTRIATLGLLEPLRPGCEVHFLPAISGGRVK